MTITEPDAVHEARGDVEAAHAHAINQALALLEEAHNCTDTERTEALLKIAFGWVSLAEEIRIGAGGVDPDIAPDPKNTDAVKAADQETTP